MRLPNPLPYLWAYAVHIAWCVASIGWAYAAWYATDRLAMVISAYTAGICGVTAFYHGLVTHLFRVNRGLIQTNRYQHEMLDTLMAMKASEVGEAVAERMQGIMDVDSPTITRH